MDILLIIIAVASVAAFIYIYRQYAEARAARAVAESSAADMSRRVDEITAKSERITAELSEARNSVAALSATVKAEEATSHRLMDERDEARKELASTLDRLAETMQENSAMATRQDMLQRQFAEMQSAAEERFKNLAGEILHSNSAIFKQQNEERLSEILSPLRNQIEEFKKKVDDTYSEEARELFSL